MTLAKEEERHAGTEFDRVLRQLESRGYSVVEIAAACGVSHTTLYRHRHGTYKPSVQMARRVVDGLNLFLPLSEHVELGDVFDVDELRPRSSTKFVREVSR